MYINRITKQFRWFISYSNSKWPRGSIGKGHIYVGYIILKSRYFFIICCFVCCMCFRVTVYSDYIYIFFVLSYNAEFIKITFQSR